MSKATGSIFISILLVMIAVVPTYAAIDSVDLRGLSEEQKAQLVQQAEQLKKQAQLGNAKATVETVNDWVNLGKNIALAFTAVAKELGVAADEFLKSTTGKITMALIVWKVAGQDILGFFTGLGLFAVFLPLWVYFFRRLCLIKGVVVKTPEKGWGRIKEYQYHDHKDIHIIVTRWVMLFVLMIGTGVGLLIML